MDKLRYGLPDVVPDSAPAAWGGRLIHDEVIAGGRGIVFDRTDCVGSPEARARLIAYLNHTPAIDAAMVEYARGVNGSVTAKTVVYTDDVVIVVASPNGSYGYLYVAACLKGA